MGWGGTVVGPDGVLVGGEAPRVFGEVVKLRAAAVSSERIELGVVQTLAQLFLGFSGADGAAVQCKIMCTRMSKDVRN